jgi:uncharacterized membrane protein YiaA
MSKFDIFITLIIIVKVIFIILAIYQIYLKHKKTNDKKQLEQVKFWKERIEFIFVLLMSVLLIYLFNPWFNNMKLLTYETKLLLYLFGFILILTADWNLFVKESPILNIIKG